MALLLAKRRRRRARAPAAENPFAEVTISPGTVRSHVTMEVAAPTKEEAEAIIRLPVPRGAAVTGAVLWVNGRPMNGMLVERQRATDVYRSIVERRRDPALVTWDGPGWIEISIFPPMPAATAVRVPSGSNQPR